MTASWPRRPRSGSSRPGACSRSSACCGVDSQAVKERKLDVLKRIDEVRNQESPAVKSAINQIAKIRAGADAQVAQSQKLINQLRNSLTVGVDSDVETIITEETAKIKATNARHAARWAKV